MLNRAVVLSVASLLAIWPSQKIMDEIICVEMPASTKIVVLMSKNVFMQWRTPVVAGCVRGEAKSLSRIRSVTGVRG